MIVPHMTDVDLALSEFSISQADVWRTSFHPLVFNKLEVRIEAVKPMHTKIYRIKANMYDY